MEAIKFNIFGADDYDPKVCSDKALQDFMQKKNLKREMDVVEIYLGNRDIKDLRSLKRFKNLSRLWLHSNKLQKLPFLLNCDCLTELYLQHNLIQTIEHCLRSLPNIEVLFLNANQLTDLNTTAHELSFLKFLRNLNLFDNPMALEKPYKKYIVHKCPSLVIFDRNTLTDSDRKRSHRLYQSERVQLENRFAFMTHINAERSLFFSPSKKPMLQSIQQQLICRNSNTAKLVSRRKKSVQENNHESNNETFDEDHTNSTTFQPTRSLKEFSYFDWSKVKLFKDRYKANEESNVNIFHKNDLSLIRTAPIRSQATRPGVNNFDILDKRENDLPQVVTIRFT